jgi:ribonuclease P protein subunit RPR2
MSKDYKKKQQQQIESRISHLFSEAHDVREKDPSLASRYVFLARKLSAKAKVRMRREFKRKFCKHCNSYFVPGKNYTVRTTGKTVTYTCKNCGKWMRIGYKAKIAV